MKHREQADLLQWATSKTEAIHLDTAMMFEVYHTSNLCNMSGVVGLMAVGGHTIANGAQTASLAFNTLHASIVSSVTGYVVQIRYSSCRSSGTIT